MAISINDVQIPKNENTATFLLEKHINFLEHYSKETEDLDHVMSEYLHMSGIYWVLTGLALVSKSELLDKSEIIKLVLLCQNDDGGFGGNLKHDTNLLYTLSAVQILATYKSLDLINKDNVAQYVASLQQTDGSFYGDQWGEIDTRFSFCAIATLKLIDRMNVINVEKAVEFIISCMNFDGGFGSVPGSESHSGQIYCCVGALSILDKLYLVQADTLGLWLCERQLPSGGLNGRPMKLPDVCYSWWVLASLKIIGRINWIDKSKLKEFILACQDDETGGISDRPGDLPDPFHTLFGLAGLSLMGEMKGTITEVNPVFCMPEMIINELDIKLNFMM